MAVVGGEQNIRNVTHKLGTQERVAANDAREFRRKLERYMDSANDASAGQYWPIVKRVKAKGKWDVLQSGAVFVDAPGVNDDNSSRDKVVKGYLKSADSVSCAAALRCAALRCVDVLLDDEVYRLTSMSDARMGDRSGSSPTSTAP